LIQEVCLAFILILGWGWCGQAQTPAAPSEYQIKAAFVYNFAKFVKWPAPAFASADSPIVIGVLGENVFGEELKRTLENKTFNNRAFELKAFHSVTEATHCQILFISPSEQDRLPQIFTALHGTSVLTVGETDHFLEAGGMINFVIEEKRIHFEINNDTAEKAGLIISSKLLSLATHSH
jgi:hypothetical protein